MLPDCSSIMRVYQILDGVNNHLCRVWKMRLNTYFVPAKFSHTLGIVLDVTITFCITTTRVNNDFLTFCLKFLGTSFQDCSHLTIVIWYPNHLADHSLHHCPLHQIKHISFTLSRFEGHMFLWHVAKWSK